MNNGIQPTVELATNNGNGFYPYPVYPMMNGGGFGNSGFLGGDGWIILLLLLAFSGNWGNNGGFFNGNNGFDNGYAWLSNGQKEIMQNTNNGFDTLHLSNQLESVNNGIHDIANAICSSTASVNSNLSNGFYNAEIAAGNRNTNMLQALNGVNTSLLNCCCENRLASCQTQNAIVSEAAATRFADANNTRDIITSQTNGTQAILDKLCQLELDNVKSQLDAKNDIIAQLRQENLYARGQASQVAQTAELRANNATVANQLVSELRACPIPSQPVYGNSPIFSCNGNNGCGCGFNTTSQFI